MRRGRGGGSRNRLQKWEECQGREGRGDCIVLFLMVLGVFCYGLVGLSGFAVVETLSRCMVFYALFVSSPAAGLAMFTIKVCGACNVGRRFSRLCRVFPCRREFGETDDICVAGDGLSGSQCTIGSHLLPRTPAGASRRASTVCGLVVVIIGRRKGRMIRRCRWDNLM